MSGLFSRIDLTRNETLVFVVILGFCLIATLSDPLFFSVTTSLL